MKARVMANGKEYVRYQRAVAWSYSYFMAEGRDEIVRGDGQSEHTAKCSPRNDHAQVYTALSDNIQQKLQGGHEMRVDCFEGQERQSFGSCPLLLDLHPRSIKY